MSDVNAITAGCTILFGTLGGSIAKARIGSVTPVIRMQHPYSHPSYGSVEIDSIEVEIVEFFWDKNSIESYSTKPVRQVITELDKFVVEQEIQNV